MTSLRYADRLSCHPSWFYEEPSPAEDRIGRRRFMQATGVPAGGDESCTRLYEVAREVSEGIAQVISIKTARTGYTESRRILNFCEAMSVPIVMGSEGDSMLGTLCTLNFGSAYRWSSQRPAELTNFLELEDDLQAMPLEITKGQLRAQDVPGLGIEIDEDKLKKYRLDL